jgi:uncharacterized membrane protein (DUF4010 family)
MSQTEILTRLAVALGIGLLVGLQRGRQTREERARGWRAHICLVRLMSGVAGALPLATGPLVLGLLSVGFAASFAAFQWLEARTDQNLSATSMIAGLLAFALGAYAVVGDMQVAAACAVAMIILLAWGQQLQGWIRGLTWTEIKADLVLLAMTFLLLPVLLDHPVDP